MGRIIPFYQTKYETKITPVKVLEQIQVKIAKPEWGITIPKLLQYQIMTGKIVGNEFEVANSRYGLTHGRMNYLLIMKGSVRKEKQSGITIISLTIQPPEATIWFYIIFSTLMIFLACYGIKKADVMIALISILFIITPYISLLFQLPKSIDVYRRFIEQDILNC